MNLVPGLLRTHLVLGPTATGRWDWTDTTVWYTPSGAGNRRCQWVVPWQPRVPHGSSLAAAPLDWLTPQDGVLEVVGLDAVGNVYWSEFDGRDADAPKSRTAVATNPDTFRAACLLASGMIAAITAKNEVHWLRVTTASACVRWADPRPLPFPARAVAVFSRPQSNEVVVILEDGAAVRVPRP